MKCLKGLGSYPKALVAGLASTVLLSGVWIGAAYLVALQFGFFALFYGAVISGAITHVSGGRGLSFQFIASVFTIAGMLFADTTVVFILWDQLPGVLEGEQRPEFFDLMIRLLEYEASTLLFMLFGLIGGLYIWQG